MQTTDDIEYATKEHAILRYKYWIESGHSPLLSSKIANRETGLFMRVAEYKELLKTYTRRNDSNLET